MIPLNDAMIVYAVVAATVALFTSLAWAATIRRRLRESYQDGHAAGIATQISRYQRAWNADLAAAGFQCDPVVALVDPYTGRDTGATLFGDRILPAPWPASQTRWGPIDDFPDGLPPGLREFATTVMTGPDAAAWAVPR